MQIHDMKAPQRTQVAQTAGHCAFGASGADPSLGLDDRNFGICTCHHQCRTFRPDSWDLTGYSVLRRFVQAASW